MTTKEQGKEMVKVFVKEIIVLNMFFLFFQKKIRYLFCDLGFGVKGAQVDDTLCYSISPLCLDRLVRCRAGDSGV